MVTVAIPTIGESPHLEQLLATVVSDPVVRTTLVMADEPGPTIYARWNQAIRYAKEHDMYLAILNDDIELQPLAITRAADLMDCHPHLVALGFNPDTLVWDDRFTLRYCRGTYRHGGVTGFAFMVDARRCPFVDEQFEWWGGDDDLMFQIEKDGGGLGVATGLHVVHHSGTSAVTQPWVAEAVGRDRQRMIDKWGEEAAW